MLKQMGMSKKQKKSVIFCLLVPLCFVGVLLLMSLGICLSAKPELYAKADFSWLVRDRHGTVLWMSLSNDEKYRYFVSLGEIPPSFIEASLLYEDRDFYEHKGVNFLALGRALLAMAKGGRKYGASTITMQLVRLAEQQKTDTLAKKLWQIWRAFVYEYHYTKDEILEAYFNLAPYGANVEGIGAASLVWFHKNAKELNLAESIALAAIPQNPSARNPLIFPNKAWDEARQRLFLLWEKKNPSPYTQFMANMPLKLYTPRQLPFLCPHAVLEIYKNRSEYADSLQNPYDREIKTTLDLPLQGELERILSQYIADKRQYGIENGAMVLANWQTGETLSLVGSENFYRENISGQIDGTNIPRSYGSTLKPFIYALALEQGLIHSKTLLVDKEKNFAGYQPENADGLFAGPLYADEALKKSRNIPAIFLAEQLKSPDLYGFLQQAGIRLPKSREHYGLALVLGGAELNLRQLASLYAMLANGGFYRELDYHQDRAKKEFPLLASEASYIVLKMLEEKSPYAFSPVISSYKTGTSNGQRDALTVGILGQYVLAVWIGNFDASSNPNFVGARAALPLYFRVAEKLQQLHGGLDKAWYTNDKLNIKEIEVCASTSDINLALCPDMPRVKAYFIPGLSPIRETGILRKILINKETGLRECEAIEGVTKEEVHEFWSSELQYLFEKAGIYKKPVPPYSLQCLGKMPILAGKPPDIVSPVKNVLYQQDRKKSQRIFLLADTEADVHLVHWFVDDSYLGYRKKNEPLIYIPKIGKQTFYAVDDRGLASSVSIEVQKTSF